MNTEVSWNSCEIRIGTENLPGRVGVNRSGKGIALGCQSCKPKRRDNNTRQDREVMVIRTGSSGAKSAKLDLAQSCNQAEVQRSQLDL